VRRWADRITEHAREHNSVALAQMLLNAKYRNERGE
jgi:hypothetical protein